MSINKPVSPSGKAENLSSVLSCKCKAQSAFIQNKKVHYILMQLCLNPERQSSYPKKVSVTTENVLLRVYKFIISFTLAGMKSIPNYRAGQTLVPRSWDRCEWTHLYNFYTKMYMFFKTRLKIVDCLCSHCQETNLPFFFFFFSYHVSCVLEKQGPVESSGS